MLYSVTLVLPLFPKEVFMDSWKVEKAKLTEADLIATFQLEMAMESERFFDLVRWGDLVRQGVSEGLKDEAKGTYYVVKTEEGTTVGSLFLTREWSDWRCAWYWWIQSVYVRPEYRRKGAYRSLYEHVKREARLADVKCLRLYVDRTNQQGLSTYRALGMVESHYLLYEEDL